jgi:hypothetical protein
MQQDMHVTRERADARAAFKALRSVSDISLDRIAARLPIPSASRGKGAVFSNLRRAAREGMRWGT